MFSEVAGSRGHAVVFALPFIFLFVPLVFICIAVFALCWTFAAALFTWQRPLATFMWPSAALVQHVHRYDLHLLTCFRAPLKKPTCPPNTCWQTAHIIVWYLILAGNDSIFHCDWGLIYIPSCKEPIEAGVRLILYITCQQLHNIYCSISIFSHEKLLYFTCDWISG